MTKSELEKLLQEEKSLTCQLKIEIERLRNLQPISEADYARLKERLRDAEKTAEYWRSAYVSIKGELSTVKEAAIRIKEDNAKLLNGYHPGITQEKEAIQANREYNIVVAENKKLQGMLDAKEDVIQYYRRIMASEDAVLKDVITEAKNTRKRTGRPRVINDKMKTRIRKLRREGLTIREIASKEGVSIGTVTEICKNINKNS